MADIFADNVFKCIAMKEKFHIFFQITLLGKFIPE